MTLTDASSQVACNAAFTLTYFAIATVGLPLLMIVRTGATVAALSNLVGNVPAVMLIRLLYKSREGRTQALIIASASTLAGKLTMWGPIANLNVVEEAHKQGIKLNPGISVSKLAGCDPLGLLETRAGSQRRAGADSHRRLHSMTALQRIFSECGSLSSCRLVCGKGGYNT